MEAIHLRLKFTLVSKSIIHPRFNAYADMITDILAKSRKELFRLLGFKMSKSQTEITLNSDN